MSSDKDNVYGTLEFGYHLETYCNCVMNSFEK